MVVCVMDLGIRSMGVMRNAACYLNDPSQGSSGLCCCSTRSIPVARKASLLFLCQRLSTTRSGVIKAAAKKSRDRAKAKGPPSAGAGGFDVKKQITTPSSFQSDQPAPVKGVETSIDEGNALQQQLDSPVLIASRDDVLKACVTTSGGLAFAGLVIRQASHWAAAGGMSFPDCAVLMPYGWELWHLGATAGTVALIATMRQLLLSLWPEFSRSSESSHQQVLSSLEPLNYLVVSFLPGIGEELLFRGALLPLVGPDWHGVAVSGLVFGLLHVTGGRNTAFAVWASFVGVIYGVAAVSTTNLAVPMVAHSIANLIAATAWRLGENIKTKERM